MTRKQFLTVFVLAAVMRLIGLGNAPLWYDENFTLILARLPFSQMIQATAGDVHPPLWYLIEWTLFHLLPDLPVWALRLPAVFFSLAAMYMLYEVSGPLILPPRVTALSVVLMAILPMQLWYAQEGRMYALLQFLVLFALYMGLKRKWVYFTLAAVALVYTQNYGLFYIGIIAALLAWMNFKANAAPILSAGIVTMFFYTPWFITVTRQMETIAGRYWIMDAGPGAVLGAIYKQFWASAMMTPGVIASYFVTFVLLILGVWTMFTHRSLHPRAQVAIVAMAFMPTLTAWIVSHLWQPLLLFRPLIGTAPFLYIIAAWNVNRLIEHFDIVPGRIWLSKVHGIMLNLRAALFAAIFIVPLLMFGVGGYYLNITAMKGEGAVSPLLDALDYVRANWQAGDVLYYTDDGAMINLLPYAADLPQYKLPACDERIGFAPVLGSLSDTTRAAMGIHTADLADVEHTRAWVFAPRSPLHPLCYEEQIAAIAPEGAQIITVDDNQFITSGVWLVDNKQVTR